MHTTITTMKTTNNKTAKAMTTATATAPKVSAQQKALNTIKEIEKKGTSATAYELQRLANAYLKQEQKSLRYVYAQLKGAFESGASDYDKTIVKIAGKTFPTFAKFKNSYKAKYVSMWGGMGTLRSLNPKFQIADKVKRQNKAEAKK